ncbi:MAG: GNAT family N-acetyltransferase [Alphaproteobacteria bacterium]|nr:GNAT family N-acetyltransferase [Alphaproteobacteria bacterium]
MPKRTDIKVRFATPEDAEQMSAVANSNFVPLEKLSERAHQGFTIWPRDQNDYANCIGSSSHVAVAEDADGKIVGHILAYDMGVFKQIAHQSGSKNPIHQYKEYPDTSIFLDQITIKPDHHGMGIGSMLDAFLRAHAPQSDLWITDIVHKPVKNEASVAFFENLGFELQDEVEHDGWILGIYEREIRHA